MHRSELSYSIRDKSKQSQRVSFLLPSMALFLRGKWTQHRRESGRTGQSTTCRYPNERASHRAQPAMQQTSIHDQQISSRRNKNHTRICEAFCQCQDAVPLHPASVPFRSARLHCVQSHGSPPAAHSLPLSDTNAAHWGGDTQYLNTSNARQCEYERDRWYIAHTHIKAHVLPALP